MKYLPFFSAMILTIFLLSCQSGNQQKIKSADSTYLITGKIVGIDSGWVYLLHNSLDPSVTDSAKIDSGFFSFKGKTAEPEFCFLGIPNNGHKEYRLGFFVDNSKINIAGLKDSVAQASVTGSAIQDEYKKFLNERKSLDEEESNLDKVYETLQSKGDKIGMDSIEKTFEIVEKKKKELTKEYTKKNPSSYVAAFELFQSYAFNPELKDLDTAYNLLDTTTKNSYYGKKLKNVLEITRKTSVGSPAPEFAQNDASGKPVALSSFKGKYVLVDFWASWCGPCRAENPNVVKAYQKFHSKGFDILGVSLDDKKDKWQEAVKKDNLAWTQVSDLQGWKNSAAELYGVMAIPMNFLLDKDGKIIGKGLRGEDLDKKLDEVLK
ncbi:MAG: AhpC/TSA family protein [Bacteroidetes bacterium]|nr:AhpC/TSA family protein [Bacteroidota bacterium]